MKQTHAGGSQLRNDDVATGSFALRDPIEIIGTNICSYM